MIGLLLFIAVPNAAFRRATVPQLKDRFPDEWTSGRVDEAVAVDMRMATRVLGEPEMLTVALAVLI